MQEQRTDLDSLGFEDVQRVLEALSDPFGRVRAGVKGEDLGVDRDAFKLELRQKLLGCTSCVDTRNNGQAGEAW